MEKLISKEHEILTDMYKKIDESEKNKIIETLTYKVVPAGKKTRALLTFSDLQNKGEQDNYNLPYLNEYFQAACLVLDDIMDNSDLRRGNPTWHVTRGPLAIKDGFFLFACCYKFDLSIKNVNLLNESSLRTSLGQTGDVFPDYTIKSYDLVCTNKNAWYTFYFPIGLSSTYPDLEEFSILCGKLHQMQDDYLNFFPKISKKSGNDLQEKKGTWFTSYCNEKLRILIDEITEEIIKETFPVFYEEEDKLLRKIEEMSVNNNTYKICYELLNKRRCCLIK